VLLERLPLMDFLSELLRFPSFSGNLSESLYNLHRSANNGFRNPFNIHVTYIARIIFE